MSDYERIALALMVLGIVVGVTGVAVLKRRDEKEEQHETR